MSTTLYDGETMLVTRTGCGPGQTSVVMTDMTTRGQIVLTDPAQARWLVGEMLNVCESLQEWAREEEARRGGAVQRVAGDVKAAAQKDAGSPAATEGGGMCQCPRCNVRGDGACN